MAGKKPIHQAKDTRRFDDAIHDDRETQRSTRHAAERIDGSHWETHGRGDQKRHAAGERRAAADGGRRERAAFRRARHRDGRTIHGSERDYRRGRAVLGEVEGRGGGRRGGNYWVGQKKTAGGGGG